MWEILSHKILLPWRSWVSKLKLSEMRRLKQQSSSVKVIRTLEEVRDSSRGTGGLPSWWPAFLPALSPNCQPCWQVANQNPTKWHLLQTTGVTPSPPRTPAYFVVSLQLLPDFPACFSSFTSTRIACGFSLILQLPLSDLCFSRISRGRARSDSSKIVLILQYS